MSSAIEQIHTFLSSLSFAEKLTLIEQIAGDLRKEGGGLKPAAAKGGKKAKKGSKNGDAGSDSEAEAKPKRKAAPGILAWQAFVKHIKDTRPDAFGDIKKEADKLTVVKGIRAENMAAYDTFVAEWKATHAASSAASVAEEAEEAVEAVEAVPVVPAPKPKSPAEKLAEVNANAAASAASAAPAAAVVPTPKKPVKTVKAAPAAPKKAKPTEESQMPQLQIDGKMYWHDPGTHGLWEVTGETFSGGSTWMGYYQPGNDEEPIRYTENFGDE
jgi:hypothetical protein